MGLITIYDHKVGALFNLIKGELQESDDFKALLGEACAEITQLEIALVPMQEITQIDSTEGVNLDVIGRRLQQYRGSKNDVDYRVFLHAAIAALDSSGTIPELFELLHLTELSTVATIVITPEYPANLRIEWQDPTLPGDGMLALDMAQLVSIAKTAGVGVYFVWWPTPSSGTVARHGDYWAPVAPFKGHYTTDDDNAGVVHATTSPYQGMGDYWTPGIGDVMAGVIKV